MIALRATDEWRFLAIGAVAFALGASLAMVGSMANGGEYVPGRTGVLAATATSTASIDRGVVLTPPPGWPTPPTMLDEEDIVRYVRDRMNTISEWSHVFIRKTYWKYFQVLGFYGAPPLEPQSTEEAERLNEVVWVVGFRSVEPFGRVELDNAIGLHIQGHDFDRAVTEAYVVLTEFGFITRVGGLVLLDDYGTPQPWATWSLEEILTLPEAP